MALMKKWYFLVPVLVFIAGVVFLQTRSRGALPPVQPTPTPLQNSNIDKVEYTCESGKTAFDSLNEKNQVKSTDSSLGKLVTAINGKEQGNGKYWLYSVDDKEATVGATAYNCQGGEKITWELK
jgi:hypothetical protein